MKMRETWASLLVLATACAEPTELAPPAAEDDRTVERIEHAVAAPSVAELVRIDDAGGARFEARHPMLPLRAALDAQGATVLSGEARVTLALAAWGRGDHLQPAEDAVPERDGSMVRYVRGAITEWYVMAAGGLEQGFTIAERPAGEGPLTLRVKSEGMRPELTDNGAAVALRDDAGVVRARYAGLMVRDARGHELPASMDVADGRIAITVDDGDAAYPVVVDPLLTSETRIEPPSGLVTSDGYFGSRLALTDTTLAVLQTSPTPQVAVFVRGATSWSLEQVIALPMSAYSSAAIALDGGTLVVSAPYENVGTSTTAGAVYVYLRSGGSWTLQQHITAPSPSANAYFGRSVAIDGDTLVVGEPYNPAGFGVVPAGSAHVFGRSGTVWSHAARLAQAAPLDRWGYGSVVAVDGTTVLVGGRGRATAGIPGECLTVWANVGGIWLRQEVVSTADGSCPGAIAVQGDTVAFVTSWPRVIRVHRRAGTTWPLEQEISYDGGSAIAVFGERLAVNRAGTVGGGGISAFIRRGASWTRVLSDLRPASGDGPSGLGMVGNRIAVGAPQATVGAATNAGAAYVFDWLGLANADACVAGAECASGFCVDGVCCNSACGGGNPGDCQACSAAAGGAASNGTCGPLSASAAAATTCRAATGACDAAETCSPLSIACPSDQLAAAGTECRGSAGGCDVAEVCDGSSAACPADAVASAGTECRGSAGDCDVAEVCDGSSAACPGDAVASAGAPCRPSSGACDLTETCDGATTECPPDLLAAAGAVCRDAVGDCDVAEACSGTSAACPADAFASAGAVCRPAAGDCDVAEACSGASAACPADALVATGTECRPSAGDCDVAEVCSGGIVCPADVLVAAGTECRASAGDCDVAEACSGSSAACPTDAMVAAGTECRASAGVCDVAEACTGSGATCPADALATAGTECRASSGDCDLAEACTGSDVACPADILASAGTVCRAAAGACDAAETCDGASASCAADAVMADGTACADALVCNGGEVCAAGECVAGDALDCDDGDECTADACAEPDGCAHAPIAGMAGCCTSDADCDDGDECTADRCQSDGACISDPLPACGGADGGATEPDGGIQLDAGDGTPIAGGCGCSVPRRSGSLPPLFGLLALVAVLRLARPKR